MRPLWRRPLRVSGRAPRDAEPRPHKALFERALLALLFVASCGLCACDDERDTSAEDLVTDGFSETDDGDHGPPICPPPEPTGYEVGDNVVDLQLTECDGTPMSLHDLCGADAALVFNYYGW